MAFCVVFGGSVGTHAIDVYAITEARRRTVEERAADKRKESRLENPNCIQAGFQLIRNGAIVVVAGGNTHLVLGKAFF